MQSAVYNATYDEFKRGYNSAADKATQQKTVTFKVCVHKVNKKKCKTTREQHWPMGIPSAYNLNQSVGYSAKAKNCKYFPEITFCHIITKIIITKKLKEPADASSFFCYLSFGSMQ